MISEVFLPGLFKIFWPANIYQHVFHIKDSQIYHFFLFPTAIRVTWQITIENQAYVEGFFIRFRDMSGGSQKFNMKTVMNSESDGAASHIITGLRKYTEYEVFLMPFYKMMEGQPSNSLHIQTLEDVPSGIFIIIFLI